MGARHPPTPRPRCLHPHLLSPQRIMEQLLPRMQRLDKQAMVAAYRLAQAQRQEREARTLLDRRSEEELDARIRFLRNTGALAD